MLDRIERQFIGRDASHEEIGLVATADEYAAIAEVRCFAQPAFAEAVRRAGRINIKATPPAGIVEPAIYALPLPEGPQDKELFLGKFRALRAAI